MRRLGIHLGRVGAVEPDHVAGELRDRDVHPEADAEVRNLPLASDAAGEDLPLPAARAEPAGDKDSVHLLELLLRLLERHPLGIHPAHAHGAALVQPGMLQRLVHRQIRVVQLDVLADEPDLDLLLRLPDARGQIDPLAQVDAVGRQPELLAHHPVEALGLQLGRERDRRRGRPGRRSPTRARRRRRGRSSRGCPARSPRASGRRRCPGGYRCAATR